MSGLKTIRRRISSVKNTKQITRAMKLVSAAKLRRAQDAATNGRAFVEHLSRIMSTIVSDLPEGFSHPLLERRETVQSRCIIAVAGERGLCGAYNTNVVKAIVNEIGIRGREVGSPAEVIAIGRRTTSNARRLGWNLAKGFEGLPEEAARWPIGEISSLAIQGFLEHRFDEVVLVYTKFVSAMSQKVVREVILPMTSQSLMPEGDESAETESKLRVKYSPGPIETFSELLPMLIHSKLVQAGLESRASEHAARMTAMDSATSNADDLIGRLQLFYNRARQSTITKELLDIIGGAEALG